MTTIDIIFSVIENLQSDKFTEAQSDCNLLPKCKEKNTLYATIGAIDSQPTELAFERTKSAAVAIADRMIGRI